MLASRVREDARRIVVDDLDVGDQRRPRVQALEQVVRQQCVLGHPALERCHERIDVVEALAGEDAFVEEVLIHVGYSGRVRIHTGVAGVRAGEQRSGGAGHGDADARLQDPVAVRNAADARIEARDVQRVRDDADELFRRVARQTGVGIEREAVAHRREDVELADLHGVAGVRDAAQQPVEFLDLSALALPSHPHALAGVPAPFAVEQEEAVRMAGAEAAVEIDDARPRGVENRRVARPFARVGVGEVAEDREVDPRIEVAQREHLDVLQQRRDPVDARQQRRHDDHRAGRRRHALREIEAGQAARRDRPHDRAVRERERDVRGRDQQEQHQRRQEANAGASVPRVRHCADQQRGRYDRDRSQVRGGRVREYETPRPIREPRPVGDVDLEDAPSTIDEVVPDVRSAIVPRR